MYILTYKDHAKASDFHTDLKVAFEFLIIFKIINYSGRADRFNSGMARVIDHSSSHLFQEGQASLSVQKFFNL